MSAERIDEWTPGKRPQAFCGLHVTRGPGSECQKLLQ